MSFRRFLHSLVAALLLAGTLYGRPSPQSPPPSSSSTHVRKPTAGSPLDGGSIRDGVFFSQALGFTCKVPAGWVLRTDEMNARDENEPNDAGQVDPQRYPSGPSKVDETNPAKTDGRVLLAAFSRPPQAAGEDVNSSILIAAESVAAYPGLKEAAQYFGPVTEVAKAQGFAVVNEPYEFPVGGKTVVREDFQKNVGSRLMRQSTLVILARGYAVSFTFIAGTEEDVEDLISGLGFALTQNKRK